MALLIQGAYLMHEGLTPTSEKPKISFSCGLDNLIAGRTLEQFGEKIIRSAKILHIRVGFSFIIYLAPAAAPQGRDTHDARR